MKTTKIKRDPIGLVELRESFGLDQKLMAMYLNMKLDSLKSIETGHRSLPTYALITIADLELQRLCKNEQAHFSAPHPAEYEHAAFFREKYQLLNAREQKCRKQQKAVANQLDLMKCNYRKLRLRLQVIEKVIAGNKGSETEMLQWQSRKNLAVHALGKCGLLVQLLTKTRLEILETEISLHNNLKLHLSNELPEFL